MAAARSHQVLKQTIRLFSPRGVEGLSTRSPEEFEESDVWNCQPESRKPATCRPQPTYKKPEGSPSSVSVSMPMHVPDWSKLHGYKKSSHEDEDNDEEEEEMGVRLPPHEIVMRKRAASSSVIEGVGRTLKGRDLSRVRNAIWAQTGFQD